MIDFMVLAAASGGFVAGVILTALVFQAKIKRRKSAASSAPVPAGAAAAPTEAQFFRKMDKAHEMLGRQKAIEVIDSNITRSDVQRHSRVGLEYHLNDLIQELKAERRLNHLIRIVINDYRDPLWEEEELREHLFEFDRDHPEIVYFLEEKSLATYLRILREARIAHYEAPLDSGANLETMKRELLQDPESVINKYYEECAVFFSNLLEDDRDNAMRVCDEVMERISNAARTMP